MADIEVRADVEELSDAEADAESEELSDAEADAESEELPDAETEDEDLAAVVEDFMALTVAVFSTVFDVEAEAGDGTDTCNVIATPHAKHADTMILPKRSPTSMIRSSRHPNVTRSPDDAGPIFGRFRNLIIRFAC